jgi:anti-sigma B factor antagonist
VDMRRLRFIDSTGLRLLLQANARAQERGYELLLRPGEPAVQRVFEVTGALEVLRFEDTPEG